MHHKKHLWLILAAFSFALVGRVAALTYAEILADPASWPVEIQVKATTKASVLQGDKITGTMLVGTGRKLTVLRLQAEGIVVRIGSATVLLPVEKTTLQVDPPVPVETTEAAAPDAVAAVAPAAPLVDETPTAMQQLLFGRLVKLEQGTLKPYDMRKLKGVKFYGVMFSAGWCGPCRQFAPHLLDSYRKLKEMYPEFELVLVSNDRSPAEMLAYMREENMPWPAVKYSELGQIPKITRLAGPGIPCLVLVDGDGKVLADSFKGSNYLGPDSVLDATWRVLKKNRHG
jgi:thiol-disulfide isomerase/thioredoxin